MRRRLDTYESISDCTTRTHHYVSEHNGDLRLDDPPPTLYDETLWAELVDAKQRLRDVERRVMAACVEEPLDAVEVELGLMMWRMVRPGGKFDAGEFSRIEDALREHAKTVERKP